MSSQAASYLNATPAVLTSGIDAPHGRIELFLGPYRSGKTNRIIDELIATHRDSPFSKTVVVVPSQRYQKVFEERLAKALAAKVQSERGSPGSAASVGLVSVTVMSFYSLVQRLLRQLGSTFRLVPREIRPQIIAQVMSRLRDEGALRNLRDHSSFLGIHNNLMELIDEFERAAFSPQEVLDRLQSKAHSASRHLELAKIFQVYWQILQELKLVDERQAAFVLVQMLASSNQVSAGHASSNHGAPDQAFNIDNLIVDGFDRFNRLQLSVLGEVAKRTKRTIIAFDYAVRDGRVYADYLWKEASYSLLQAQFQHRCQTTLFDRQDSVRQPAVSRFEAPDRLLEMEEIARRVKSALLVDKVPPEEILVVVRSLSVYADAARTAFEDAGISHFVDEPQDCSKIPVIQFITRMTRLEFDGLKRKDVVWCLRSRYLSEAAGLSAQEIELIDRRSMEHRVVGGRDQWQQLFAAADQAKTAGKGLEAGAWWQEIGAKLFALFDRLKPLPLSNVSGHVRWLEDILDHLFQPLFSSRQERTRHQPQDSRDSAYRRFIEQKCLGEFRRCLSTLLLEESFLGEESWSAADFFARLDRLLAGANFRNHPKSKAAVIICGADLAPNRSFSRVFIGGLVEGEFPRKIGATGFVGPDEIRSWNSFDVDISNPRFHPGFETALFANLAARAREELHLSYSSYEFNGEELLPSFLISLPERSGPNSKNLQTSSATTNGAHLETTAAVGHMSTPSRAVDVANSSANKIHIDFAARALEMPVSARNLLSGSLLSLSPFSRLEKAQQLFDYACHGAMGAQAKGLAQELRENLVMMHGRLSCDRRSIFNGYLCGQVAAGSLRVPLPRRFSATGLSDYGKCGFKYWVSHILHSEPIEEPRSGLDARLLGEVCHKSLELFYASLMKNNLRITDPLETLGTLLDDAIALTLQWLEARRSFRPTEFWHLERSEIRFRLHRFLAKERERAFKDRYAFSPHLLEAGFGLDNEESFPPLLLQHGEESIEIRGRIDRIDKATDDRGHEILRLIDYKKGSALIPAEEAHRGRNLQLPLYALAARDAIDQGADVVEGRYLSIWSGAVSGRLKFGQWERLDDPQNSTSSLPVLEKTQRYVFQYVQEIAGGKFTVEPNGLDLCKRCQHHAVCRISELKPAQSGTEGNGNDPHQTGTKPKK
jgi:ATP-dependent helicase/DNAse subunit B